MNLPPGWRWSTVAEVGTVDLGRQRHPDWHTGPEMRPYLRVANVFEDRIDTSDVKEMDFSGVFERYKLREGDVLLNEGQSPEFLGRPAIYRGQPENVAFTNTLLRFRAGHDVIPEWALLVFRRHMHFRRFVREARITTNIAHLSAHRLKSVELPVPPINEQRRIVDIVEDHLSRLNAADSYLETGIRRTQMAHAGILSAAMTGALIEAKPNTHTRDRQLATRSALCPPDMKRGRPDPYAAVSTPVDWPPHWTRVSLEEATHPVRTISYGILKPGPNVDGGVPYVRVVNMRGDVLAIDDLHRTTPAIAKQYERAALERNDVLVSIRGTYGRVVVVPHDLQGANITQDTARLAFVGPIFPEFGAAYLRSPRAQNYFRRVARGVAVKGVNIADLRTMPFPIPSTDEQVEIVRRLDELISDIRSSTRAVVAAQSRARSLRRSLLDAAFAGRLTGGRSDMDVVEEMAGV